MKSTLSILTLVLLFNACTTNTSYQIEGLLGEEFDDSIVLLTVQNKNDTIEVRDHTFTFSGPADTVRLAYLKLPSFPRKQEVILEPGIIKISYESKNSFSVSGTPTNEAYYEYLVGKNAATDKVLEGYQVYKNAETREAQDEALRRYDQLEEDRRVYMRAHLRKNPNYVGVLIMKNIYKTDSIENLAEYLELLSDFSYTDMYKEVDAYNTAITSTLPGNPAPDFVLPDSSGNKIALESLRGKYVLLDFWFTGCTYCDMLVPHMKNIYADIHDRGFEIIDISVDKERSKWLGTVKKKNSPWIHLHDADKSVANSFAMPGYPTLILIDKDGIISDRLVGYREEAQLREEILSVLDQE